MPCRREMGGHCGTVRTWVRKQERHRDAKALPYLGKASRCQSAPTSVLNRTVPNELIEPQHIIAGNAEDVVNIVVFQFFSGGIRR